MEQHARSKFRLMAVVTTFVVYDTQSVFFADSRMATSSKVTFELRSQAILEYPLKNLKSQAILWFFFPNSCVTTVTTIVTLPKDKK